MFRAILLLTSFLQSFTNDASSFCTTIQVWAIMCEISVCMLQGTVGLVDQMLNLSKNGIKLLSTHSVVGIEPVWIFSQIFLQSVKLTKIITHLIYRVYPIPLIIFFPSKKKSSAAVAFLLFIIIIITMVYIYRNASKCYVAEFTRSV